MYERDLPTAVIGDVDAAPGKMNEILGERDPLLERGRFSLVGSVDPESGRIANAGLTQDLGGNIYSVFFLEEERLQDVVRSEITQLRNDVGVDESGEIGIGEGLSIARELLAPGGGIAGKIAGELVDPAVNMAKGALGLGESAEIRDIAQELAYQGVSPENVNPRGDQFRTLIASRAPNLVPAEALEMDASMPSASDDLLESSELADGTIAARETADANMRKLSPANENIGNSYFGTIESVDDDAVVQRVGDDLVSHRSELFDDRAADRELAIGKEVAISYEHDGPVIGGRSLSRDLGIER